MITLFHILKFWLYSFLSFLVVCLIIPKDRPFTDATIYVNLEPPTHQQNTIYIFIKDKKFKKKLQKWIGQNNYKNVLVIVPRWEFFIYYIYFMDHKIFSCYKFKMGAKSHNWSLQTLFYTYHQTIWEICSFVYKNIKYYFLCMWNNSPHLQRNF